MLAEYQNFRLRDFFADLPSCVKAIQLRHADVENNNIRFEFFRLSDGINAIYGFTANRPVGTRL